MIIIFYIISLLVLLATLGVLVYMYIVPTFNKVDLNRDYIIDLLNQYNKELIESVNNNSNDFLFSFAC